MQFFVVPIKKDQGVECIIGQGNFSVLTVDSLAATLLAAAPGISFGVAMNEAKPRLVRVEGNDENLKAVAAQAALDIGAGHAFVVMMTGAYPINVLGALKGNPGVCAIFGASENPLEAVIGETPLGRAVLGIVDGTAAAKIETPEEKAERKALLKMLGYAG
jgi:adenosine/AMP kinase